MAREFTAIFKGLGFKFVTLDLEGFRSGSMNQLLSAEELARGRWNTGPAGGQRAPWREIIKRIPKCSGGFNS